MQSKLFPTLYNLDNVKDDLSSAMIVTGGYDGIIQVFLRKSCFDAVVHEAGPDGELHRHSED